MPALRQTVRGYLTGSLDLVVRLPGPEGPRFAVLDYKTNWLGEPDRPLTASHYRPSVIADEMQRHHYALQALLYAVALHRYLRWRLPGHDPERRPRRSGLSVPARDDRGAGAGDRRRAERRVRVAAAPGSGAGAQ